MLGRLHRVSSSFAAALKLSDLAEGISPIASETIPSGLSTGNRPRAAHGSAKAGEPLCANGGKGGQKDAWQENFGEFLGARAGGSLCGTRRRGIAGQLEEPGHRRCDPTG